MTLTSTIQVAPPDDSRLAEILSPEAIEFVTTLHNRFAASRCDLLAARRERRAELLAGGTLDFLPETAAIREDPSWRVAPPAPGLVDRRVEITGPTDRKMTINALNSGAKVWLADFEDANSPTWSNMVDGQRNLRDAVSRHLELVNDDGRRYVLGDDLSTIVVRPRGLHLVEKHVLINGHPISASLFDFGLYLFHCGRLQIDAGCGPYFYLPKVEHYEEARWWNEVFVMAQDMLGLAQGTIRATTLIETITAAFQMEEILYELRYHSAGLNAGRWDYIFSIIKNFGDRPEYVLPDRAAVVMTVPFMQAYTDLLVATCHRRGAHAIGGMSAFIPSRNAKANAVAFAAVQQDKQREANAGYDGSWVAHPGLVPVCREAFTDVLADTPNQLQRQFTPEVTATELLAIDQTPGQVTDAGVRQNVTVALRYLQAWLQGAGAVAIDHLMEDAATAEISRSQLRQWVRLETALPDGRPITAELVNEIIDTEFDRLTSAGEQGITGSPVGLSKARELLRTLVFADQSTEFFTTAAYGANLLDRLASRRRGAA